MFMQILFENGEKDRFEIDSMAGAVYCLWESIERHGHRPVEYLVIQADNNAVV